MTRIEKFNPAHFEIGELVDYLYDKIDIYIVEECAHFIYDGYNPISDATRYI